MCLGESIKTFHRKLGVQVMSESGDLFIREDPIFVNKELLEISHLPDEDRIVGRDEEISQLANAVKNLG